MDAWWTRLGLQVTGKDALEIEAREHVLGQVVPTLFDSPTGLTSRARMEEVVAAAGRAADHIRETIVRNAAGWSEIPGMHEAVATEDAVPEDVWERFSRSIADQEGPGGLGRADDQAAAPDGEPPASA